MKVHVLEGLATGVAKACESGRLRQNSSHMVQIVFGARDRNCAGSGICKARELIRSQGLPLRPGCRGNMAIAQVQIRPNHLVFTFSALCPRLIQQYFYGDMFFMECDADLELKVRGEVICYALRQGTYPVSRCGGWLVVAIPVSRERGHAKKGLFYSCSPPT